MNTQPELPQNIKAMMKLRIKSLRGAVEHNKADDMQLVLHYFTDSDARRMITDIVADLIGM